MNIYKTLISGIICCSIIVVTSCSSVDPSEDDIFNQINSENPSESGQTPGSNDGVKVDLASEFLPLTLSGSYFSYNGVSSVETQYAYYFIPINTTANLAADVVVNLEEDKQYVENLLNGTGSANEVAYVAGGQFLPTDCYTIGNTVITIPEGENSFGVMITIDKAKVAQLNPYTYVKWLLPAFKIASAEIDIINPDKVTLPVINVVRPEASPSLSDNDIANMTNIVLGTTTYTQCRAWGDNPGSLGAVWLFDGNKDINANNSRWVPYTRWDATDAPWVEINLGGTYDIQGFRLFYQNEGRVENGRGDQIVQPRQNCYFFAEINGVWYQQEALLDNTSLTPSYKLAIKNASKVRITWDKILGPPDGIDGWTNNYFMKVKELEIYGTPS